MYVKRIKMLGAAVLISSLISVPCAADSGKLTVSDAIGNVSGSKASYSANIKNETGEDSNPIMVLVWYEDGMLKGIDATAASVANGKKEQVSTEISVEEITDYTKISGFILENKKYSIPIRFDEIERLGNNSVKIEGFKISGLGEDINKNIKINEESKEINVLLPAYQKLDETEEAEEVLSTQEISVQTENAKSTVKIDGEALSGDLQTKQGTVDLAGEKTVTVTAEDGTEGEYKLYCTRYIFDDFDNNTVFNNVTLTGIENQKTGWNSSSDEISELINSEAAKKYFTYDRSEYGNAWSKYISIGVSEVSKARQIENSNAEMPVGSSGALGKALKISKTEGHDDNNSLWLRITNDAFKATALTSTLVVEYDMAFDYTNANKQSTGKIGCTGGGIRYFANNANYTLFDEQTYTSIPKTSPNLKLRYQNKNSYTLNGTNNKPNVELDTWHHIKTVLDPINKTAIMYIDNEEVSCGKLDVSSYWTSGFLVNFQPSGWRAIDIWVDNIRVEWR